MFIDSSSVSYRVSAISSAGNFVDISKLKFEGSRYVSGIVWSFCGAAARRKDCVGDFFTINSGYRRANSTREVEYTFGSVSYGNSYSANSSNEDASSVRCTPAIFLQPS